jgi:peptide/nickel transport system substrate-binding protein
MILAFLGFLSLSRKTVTIPDVGGVYTEALAGRPQFINPLLAQYNQVDQDLTALIFDGLTQMDGGGHLQPQLARSWDISEDGRTYVFRLRRDVRWQDGETFTADDVLFTINLMQDPEFPGAPYLGQLWQSVQAEQLGSHTVRFILPEPLPAFAEFTTIGILPQHLLAEMPARDLLNHPSNLNPVGTGPYKIDSISAQAARLAANPFYWGGKPRLAQLEFQFYGSYQESLSALKNEEVEGISFIPPDSMSSVENLDPLNIYAGRLSGYNTIYLNLQNPNRLPFFQDKAVRQALLAAIDRQAIIDEALNGQALAATGPILPWSWAYNDQQETIGFDPQMADDLLNESGWVDADGDGVREKDGVPLAFTLFSSEEPDKIAVAEAVSQQWQRSGISTTVEIVGAGLGQRLVNHNFEAALAEVLIAGDPDPYPLWHQTQIDGGQNYAGWDHTEASKLLETARTITDQGRRNDYYFEFQRIFANEVPALILYHPVHTYGVSADIHDVQVAPMTNPSDRFNTITDWYVLTRQVVYDDGQLNGKTSQ